MRTSGRTGRRRCQTQTRPAPAPSSAECAAAAGLPAAGGLCACECVSAVCACGRGGTRTVRALRDGVQEGHGVDICVRPVRHCASERVHRREGSLTLRALVSSRGGERTPACARRLTRMMRPLNTERCSRNSCISGRMSGYGASTSATTMQGRPSTARTSSSRPRSSPVTTDSSPARQPHARVRPGSRVRVGVRVRLRTPRHEPLGHCNHPRSQEGGVRERAHALEAVWRGLQPHWDVGHVCQHVVHLGSGMCECARGEHGGVARRSTHPLVHGRRVRRPAREEAADPLDASRVARGPRVDEVEHARGGEHGTAGCERDVSLQGRVRVRARVHERGGRTRVHAQ